MKRNTFLKSLIGISVVSAIPVSAVEKEKEYLFDELFEQPYENEILYYPKKDSELYVEIKRQIGKERILNEKHFRAYLGYHYNLIPIKKSYTISDFMPFILALNSYYHKNNVYAEWDKGVFFRMIRESNTDTMHFDTFLADRPR